MELWDGKASGYSDFTGLLCGKLDDKDDERNEDYKTWLVKFQE